MYRPETILDTRARPNLTTKTEPLATFEIQTSTEPLPNICVANKNLLRMLVINMLPVYLSHTRVTFKFIACKTLLASAIIGADFHDQHVRAIRSKQKLQNLDDGNCIPNVQISWVAIEIAAALLNGYTYSKGNKLLSPIVHIT